MPVAPGNQLDPTIDETFDMFAQYYKEDNDPIAIGRRTRRRRVVTVVTMLLSITRSLSAPEFFARSRIESNSQQLLAINGSEVNTPVCHDWRRMSRGQRCHPPFGAGPDVSGDRTPIRNTRRIRAVMQSGGWIDRDAIRAQYQK